MTKVLCFCLLFISEILQILVLPSINSNITPHVFNLIKTKVLFVKFLLTC